MINIVGNLKDKNKMKYEEWQPMSTEPEDREYLTYLIGFTREDCSKGLYQSILNENENVLLSPYVDNWGELEYAELHSPSVFIAWSYLLPNVLKNPTPEQIEKLLKEKL